MNSYTGQVNGKPIVYTDDGIQFGNSILPFAEMSDIVLKDGESPAWQFTYKGRRMQVPYSLSEKDMIEPFLLGAINKDLPEQPKETKGAVEKLKEAKQLLDEGIISEEEFQTVKSRLLDEMVSEPPKAEEPYVAPQTQINAEPVQTPVQEVQTRAVPVTPTDEGATTGMKVLSFLFPIVGLILFIIDRDKKPAAAKDELKWAGIGCGVGILGYILLFAMGACSGYYYY